MSGSDQPAGCTVATLGPVQRGGPLGPVGGPTHNPPSRLVGRPRRKHAVRAPRLPPSLLTKRPVSPSFPGSTCTHSLSSDGRSGRGRPCTRTAESALAPTGRRCLAGFFVCRTSHGGWRTAEVGLTVQSRACRGLVTNWPERRKPPVRCRPRIFDCKMNETLLPQPWGSRTSPQGVAVTGRPVARLPARPRPHSRAVALQSPPLPPNVHLLNPTRHLREADGPTFVRWPGARKKKKKN